MKQSMRADAQSVIEKALRAVQPDEAVRRALDGRQFSGRLFLISVGKAAWQMAKAAHDCLDDRVENGLVLTKYEHVKGPIANFICCEGGHPIPDEGSFRGTQAALDMVAGLGKDDTVLFLLSGGGSALFEKPLIPADELRDITAQLLASGADIVEMNTVRKRLSAVKGGRFAQACAPAKVFSIVLSDILGDPLDMIASGPASPDPSTCEQAKAVVEKYDLRLSDRARALLEQETPKYLDNAESLVVGSVRELCKAAAGACKELGYEPILLTDMLCCQAKEAGSFLASIARSHAFDDRSLAFIAGGETVVQLTGKGKGGRNQELALSAAEGIEGLENVLIFSVGSDGTDGPTDAAGGIVNGRTKQALADKGVQIHEILADNNAYHALASIDGLIVTGPTGTNVNDVAVALIQAKGEYGVDIPRRGERIRPRSCGDHADALLREVNPPKQTAGIDPPAKKFIEYAVERA